jgi:hypothetical protein
MPRWARAQLWLGNLCVYFSDYTTAVGHYTEVCEADAGNPTAPEVSRDSPDRIRSRPG